MLLPRDAQDLCQIVSDAAADGTKLEVLGGGTRAAIGAPRECSFVALRNLKGVIEYDPAELVLTVRPGTPLTEVEELVAAEGQMLGFEPWGEPGSTIGGAVAAGSAGSRRITAGSARDHLLGFTAVSGRGESFVAGGKVVKNVTGYDLPKLMAGSWGRIGAMTELTLKVLPSPRKTLTLTALGLLPRDAYRLMAASLGSCAGVSAAACLGTGQVLLRIAGFEPSVAARRSALQDLLDGSCDLFPLDEREAASLWQCCETGHGLSGSVLWDVHLPPRRAPDLVETLQTLGAEWSMDWGGGRVWVALDEQAETVREATARLGGTARLVRAPGEMRVRVPAFHPREPAVMALEQRVRRAFDPAGVFVTGRFLEDAHADQLFA